MYFAENIREQRELKMVVNPIVELEAVPESSVKQLLSYLLLEDGTLFTGHSFGAEQNSEGEIGKITAPFT